jgi:uncharacterized membrane protein YeiH
MVFDTVDLVDYDIARGRRRTKASATWLLSLAAAPTFAIMALLTGAYGGSLQDVICSAGGSPLMGMMPMYLAMSAFHLPPWIRLFSRR